MMEEAASQLERDHVHSVYEKIAPYFNDSRYKAWPKVRQFLLDQEPGSIIADVGCGNGKYFHINRDVFKLGCDVCRPLVDAAWDQGHEVQLCDGLRLPYRDGCFDAVLSIAVIHHLSTKERRVRAIKEMARTLRVGGRIMIYVWAMEQKRRKFEKQDIFVPWNPNPPPDYVGERPAPRRRATTQSISGVMDNSDKQRKVKSTSSMVDEEDLNCGSQQKSQRRWFFSRSLDSVFDFGSLTISRSSSRELSTLSTPVGQENTGSKAVQLGRGSVLIKQVSSLFSSSSRTSLEEDVFDSVADLHRGPRGGGSTTTTTTDKERMSAALAQECGSVALPDLVSYIKEPSDEPRVGAEHVSPGESQACMLSPREREGQAPASSCLRYYHVFRKGEVAKLIENHVEELQVLHSYFDHANWCVVAEKVQVWKI
ncbi:probable tRNA methyltransferase 9B [Hypomesus transpacificus]|uniref:probable tRNA methyltransferase 9B n=1 Tax=Hypomesus transpacificus TaxID=137520 RepID=UPI001F073031|nr:probable tRNA methyltransferase 9B [Hypomesus transpacificus]XP_046891335.1 probable tRNA methyltransferase 9B [Hypomesus transpacificus]